MQSELFPVEIRFTDRFKKDVKRLKKKYRSIQADVEPFLDVLRKHQCPGDRLQEVGAHVVYKERLKNSDNNKGQSGGYRVLYLVVNANEVQAVNVRILLLMHSKSDQDDIGASEVCAVIDDFYANQGSEEPQNQE